MNADELTAGVRTVVQVASFFGELKMRARLLAEQIHPQQRGYFTASEEEQATGLLVSYWQARNALFELITSFRQDTALEDSTRQRAFVTAYGAALVLIDAARFLRELVVRRPVVQSKLNQAVPQCGVPAGVYDTVQRSLTSARHGWHLYHAIQFYANNQPQLRQLSVAAEYAQLFAVIDELQHRLNVSVAQFAEARWRTRADQLARAVASQLVGRALYGIQKLAGSLVSDKYLRYGHRPALPPEVAAAVQQLLVPGDVLIVRKEYALTNYFLPGHWPHAALYLGDAAALARLGIQDREHVKPRWARLLEGSLGSPHRVLEAMKDGVRLRSMTSPFASDSIVVLRPALSPDAVGTALARVFAHEGKPYDFDFDFRRSDRLVCTEVVYRAYDGMGSIQIPLVQRAGRPTLSGSDLIRMGVQGDMFRPVAVYAPSFGSTTVTGPAVTNILRQADRLA